MHNVMQKNLTCYYVEVMTIKHKQFTTVLFSTEETVLAGALELLKGKYYQHEETTLMSTQELLLEKKTDTFIHAVYMYVPLGRWRLPYGILVDEIQVSRSDGYAEIFEVNHTTRGLVVKVHLTEPEKRDNSYLFFSLSLSLSLSLSI